MKIAFIYSGAENLGIEYLAGFLKEKGHKVFLLFDAAVFSGDCTINNKFLAELFCKDEAIVQRLGEIGPDLVAFSAYTGNYRWCLKLARRIKEAYEVPIVFGGVHTSSVPEKVLANDFVDFAIIGEGEFAMLDLVKHLERSAPEQALLELPNICFRYQGGIHLNAPRPYISDLDALPFPDKALFYDKVPLFEKKYLIITSRGCPYNCTYCSNNMYHKLYGRQRRHFYRRSPDNVIAELLNVKKRRRSRLVVFADDVFTHDRDWLGRFIEQYKRRINIPFFCSVHPLTVTRETASLLKEGGCWFVTMGIQSWSESIRKNIFRRPGSNEQIIQAISYIKEQGIKISVDGIFGSPTETEEDLKHNLKLYCRVKPDRIFTHWLTFYPKTDIISCAKEHKLLSEEKINEIEEGYVGYTHDTGSVSSDKVAVYAKYDFLFNLCALIKDSRLYSLIHRFVDFIPFKKTLSKLVLLCNAVKNRDFQVLSTLSYIWTKKDSP